MKTTRPIIAITLALFLIPAILRAQVPQLLNYQGRVVVGTVNFDGSGAFKFALVNGNGSVTYWSNAPDITPSDGVPDVAVSLTVTKGLYSVLLGDTALPNMAAVPATVFNNADVRLRVWFDDGTINGSQLLTPDQRIAAVGYAMIAGNVPDGAITTAKLATGLALNGTLTGNASTATSFTGALGGDVTGIQAVTVVSTVGGSTAASVNAAAQAISTATALNVPGTIMKRDGAGNVTLGTVAADLAGNATTATTALNFSGALAGNVTGTQSNTVVGVVGGVTAANVAAGANLANAATSGNTANAIVLRNGSGSFSAGTVTLAGNLNLPDTTASTGIIFAGGTGRVLHSYLGQTFVGGSAGNFTMTGQGNVGVGYATLLANTGGSSNVAVGELALFANTTGSFNSALGKQALTANGIGEFNTAIGFQTLGANTSGSRNTATGVQSLSANMTGANNTATGYQALKSNTGDSNTATGMSALYSNTTGSSNTATGELALYTNGSGIQNTAIGQSSLKFNSTGSSNTASGVGALNTNTIGHDNTANGAFALYSNTKGGSNTAGGTSALYANTTAGRNVAIGNSALLTQSFANGGTAWDSKNVAVGFEALKMNQPTSVSNGTNNTAIGYQSLGANTTGSSNTASGAGALDANTAGGGNTASGSSSLSANLSGNSNTATGVQALLLNTVGSSNTASGFSAMFGHDSGDANTAIGASALAGNIAGTGNTTVGSYTLSSSAGSYNTALGYSAASNLNAGDNNLMLGNQTGDTLTSGSNNVYIAANGPASENNIIRIGGPGYHTATYMAGIHGVTSSGGTGVYINAAGQLGTNTSSRRFKQDVRDMDKASEGILSLRPVSFHYKPEFDAGGLAQFGLIAEEVNEVNPDLVVRDDKGEIYSVRYEQVNAMLLNEFLKDHRRADAKDIEIAELKKRLADLESKDKAREERLATLEQFMPPTAKPGATKVAVTEDAPPTK